MEAPYWWLKMPRSKDDSGQVCWLVCVGSGGDARVTGVDLIMWPEEVHDVTRHYSLHIYTKAYICKCRQTTLVDIAQQLYICRQTTLVNIAQKYIYNYKQRDKLVI